MAGRGTGLAGALIVALALPASTRMEPAGLPRSLVAAAVVLAVLTVTAAVGAMVLRGVGRLPGQPLVSESPVVSCKAR